MRKNLLNKMMFKLRVKTGYNVKKKDKSFYRKQFFNLIICIIVILIILVVKQINTKPTNKVINVVKDTIEHDTDFVKSGKKVVDFASGIINKSDNIKSVFNRKNNDDLESYIIPVNGTVYREFGQEQKPNNITVFYKGIDILAKEEIVVAMGDGEVIKVENDNVLGKVITIDHKEFIARYGHIKHINVSRGDIVKKGDKIGALDNIEDERRKLYLEILEDGKPINPLNKITFSSSNLVAR